MDDAVLSEFLPDVNTLFAVYDQKYFEGVLGVNAFVEWSDRMTLCAGKCYYRSRANYLATKGDAESPPKRCRIALSRPLLQLRPFKDTIDTLLHEMIHAYLFIKTSGRLSDRDGHGDLFCALKEGINCREGTSITIYHAFRDEVRYFKKHVWRCDGPCRNRPPHYGWVRRAMNRPPQPADRWWGGHLATCSGTFAKVSGQGGPPEKGEPAPRTALFSGKCRTLSPPVVDLSVAGGRSSPEVIELD